MSSSKLDEDPSKAETPGESSPMLDESGGKEPGDNSISVIQHVTCCFDI